MDNARILSKLDEMTGMYTDGRTIKTEVIIGRMDAFVLTYA